MNRRQLLRRAGLVATTAALAGCDAVRPPSPGPERPPLTPDATERPPRRTTAAEPSFDFETVVDLSERGADGDGTRSISDLLDEEAADGRLLYLPEGRYRLTETWEFGSFSRFGIVGQNATIVPDEGYEGVLFSLGSDDVAKRLLVEGLTFDFRAAETGGRPLFARARNRLVARDLTVRGRQDVDQDMFRFDVTDPDGYGWIERLHLPDGASAEWKNTGCEVGDDNRGDLDFVDCRISGFPDNGLYADPPEGAVRVAGGTYRNNGIAGVRIDAGPGSVVRNVHVRCDEAREGVENMRGIRLRGGRDVLVENCLVEMLDVTSSDGAITFASELGSATVRNTRVRIDADGVNAVRIKHADGSGSTGPYRCENLVVTGTAAKGPVIWATERDDCVFDGLCITQTGADRDGVLTSNITGELRDAYIAVTGRPYHFEGSRVATSGVTVSRTPTDESGAQHCG